MLKFTAGVQQALLTGLPTHDAFQGKATDEAALPGAPSTEPLLTEDQWAETCPIKLELYSYILICIFTNQSEQLHNDQSECTIQTIQGSVMWTNQTT